MACCSAKQRGSFLYSKMSNVPTHLQERIRPVRKLCMNLETIGLLFEKFQTFSTVKHGIEVCEEAQFKDMIGILGSFYIGTRIFNVVLQLSLENERRMRAEYESNRDHNVIQIWSGSKYSKNTRDFQDERKERKYIVVEDYIIYMDMIYHGTDDEKDLISFMMIDEVGLGKIVFPFYENFLIQFYNMYGELLQTKAIEEDQCQKLALEVFQMIA